MSLAYVALGANLDDPAAQLTCALASLGELSQTTLIAASSLYRTAPVGVTEQPDYVNAVCALQTELTPEALLEALLGIETQFGRRRDYHYAPRTLDLDLLLFDAETRDSAPLTLPHPRMHLRAFVLAPLVEIAPDCRIPGRGTAVAWLAAASMQRIEKIAR